MAEITIKNVYGEKMWLKDLQVKSNQRLNQILLMKKRYK